MAETAWWELGIVTPAHVMATGARQVTEGDVDGKVGELWGPCTGTREGDAVRRPVGTLHAETAAHTRVFACGCIIDCSADS